MDKYERRRLRLIELRDTKCDGKVVKLAERMDRNASYVSRLLYPAGKAGGKRMADDMMEVIEKAFNLPRYWLDQEPVMPDSQEQNAPTSLSSNVYAVDEHEDNNPLIARIRKVKLRLSAGIVGFAVDPDEEDGDPIYFRKNWLAARGYKPGNLIAIRVKGESMEPNLHEGDTLVVNTADTTPRDGETFAINYEGEAIVKRMMRDSGSWWLSSDNPDQRRYPIKKCIGEACIIIGRIIHRQTEQI